MKSSIVLPLIVVIGAVSLTTNCRSATGSKPPTNTPASNTSSASAAGTSVNYKGVHFTLDPSLAPQVKSETLPASVEGKPSDIWPEHPGFTLVGYPRPRAMAESDPEIRVFSVSKYREAMTIAGKEHAKSLPSGGKAEDWAKDFDDEVALLKKLLNEKPTGPEVDSFLTKARGKTPCGAMPWLPMWDACQAFVSDVKYIHFKNGQGVFFLTQWDTETSQVTNAGLEYAFQGITDDGQHYVYGEFSVLAPVLPKGDEPEVKAWDQKNYLLDHNSTQYQQYIRAVVTKLEALPADKFQPSLALLEKLMASLELQPE
jgi:hypothetical protein